MKGIKRFIGAFLIVTMVLGATLPVHASAMLPSGTNGEAIGTEIDAYVAEHEDTTAGMSVSVFGQQETFYTGYYGYTDKENGVLFDSNTVVEWGSATKLLVWISVMQLWEQGKLDLEKDVKEYLSIDFLNDLTYSEPITMIDLMNHQAGFQECYADLFVKDKNDILPLEEALKAHMPAQIFEPGTVSAYSNWGAALAGLVVEKISGMSFADYVHENIFVPLEMEHSALKPDLSDNAWVQEKRKELQCYTEDGELVPDCFYYITWYPAGMCTSTLEDFASFGKALLNETSPLFEKENTWQTLFTPTEYYGDSEIPSNYHGFWVIPYGVEVVGHGGNTAGCSSYLTLDLKSRIGMVVMTNQSGESVYNYDMQELIFGKFSVQNYFKDGRKDWKGIFRSARSIRKGPMKLISLSSFMMGEPERDDFWVVGNSEIEKVCYLYGDFVDVPVWEFALEIGLVFLWVLSFGFSLVSLLGKLIKVCRKQKTGIMLSGWSTLAAVVQIINILMIGWMAFQIMSFAASSTYLWTCYVFAILIGVMLALAIYGVGKMRRVKLTKVCKLYHWSTVISLLTSVINMFYWNLFMWWMI